MENKFEFLACEGVHVGAFIEGHSIGEHSSYSPSNILFYITQGQLNLKINNELHTISKNNFCFVRKFTKGTYFKTWSPKEKCAIMYAFLLQDEFIQEAIQELKLEIPFTQIHDKVIHLPKNKILKGLFDSIVTYLSDNESINASLVQLKTKEALLGILKSNDKFLNIFTQFTEAERADLEDFMNHNFQLHMSLKKLAKLSGRSLSTFNRELKY